MTHAIRTLVTAFLVFTVCAIPAASASDRATPDEAKAMVKKALAYVKANGRDKAFAEFNNTKGAFTDRDLYVVVYDINGKNLAHGANPRMIGKDLIDMKDPDGKPFVKERVEIAKTKGSGWQEYKFLNPATKQIEQKTMYVEKIDDLIVGCGAYKA